MDAQDFRSLQEAYMEVVINEGEKPYPSDKVKRKLDYFNNKADYATDRNTEDKYENKAEKLAKKHSELSSRAYIRHPQKKSKTQREDYDIYDIILSHLLDEGYAETLEAAEAIMVNMSEEWREEIVEQKGNQNKKNFPISKKTSKKDIKAYEPEKRYAFHHSLYKLPKPNF
jgi:hypothetical protein